MMKLTKGLDKWFEESTFKQVSQKLLPLIVISLTVCIAIFMFVAKDLDSKIAERGTEVTFQVVDKTAPPTLHVDNSDINYYFIHIKPNFYTKTQRISVTQAQYDKIAVNDDVDILTYNGNYRYSNN